MTRSEEEIKKNVVNQLRWDSRLDISDLRVDVSGGEVKVAGTIPAWRMREIVNMDVLDVAGVKYLVNNLKVLPRSTEPLPEDEQIKADIDNMLALDPDINPENITVAVNKGILTLEGSVNAIWQKLKAETIASNASGLRQINNALAVVPTGTYADQAISEDIMAAFSRNVHIEVQDVSLRVENQTVFLSGTVPSWKAFYSARDIAFYTRGVVEVQNNLRVC